MMVFGGAGCRGVCVKRLSKGSVLGTGAPLHLGAFLVVSGYTWLRSVHLHPITHLLDEGPLLL
jgi:hypothetical protein